MPIYTIEHPNSPKRLAQGRVVADTSYIIVLSDKDDKRNPFTDTFHFAADAEGATFLLNVVARQEFMRKARVNWLKTAMLYLAQSDPDVERTYKLLAGIKKAGKELTESSLDSHVDAIYKNHVRNGDVARLRNTARTLGPPPGELLSQIEAYGGFEYVGKTDASVDLWPLLWQLMDSSGMAPPDCMIATMGMGCGANAIVAMDCDYVFIHPIIDVYVPKAVAERCEEYKEELETIVSKS